MRYTKLENPYIIGRFTTGDTCIINIYDLTDNSVVISAGSMTEVLSTGFFKYKFDPSPNVYTEYMYIINNSIEEHAGKIILGGYVDDILDDTDSINTRLPSDPADQSLITSTITSATSALSPSGEYNTRLTNIQTDSDRILGLLDENSYLDSQVYNGDDNLTSARKRIYSVASSVGTTDDVVATYTITATWSGTTLNSYKMVKV